MIFPLPQHKPPAGNRHYHKENRNNKGPDTTAAAYGNKYTPDKKSAMLCSRSLQTNTVTRQAPENQYMYM